MHNIVVNLSQGNHGWYHITCCNMPLMTWRDLWVSALRCPCGWSCTVPSPRHPGRICHCWSPWRDGCPRRKPFWWLKWSQVGDHGHCHHGQMTPWSSQMTTKIESDPLGRTDSHYIQLYSTIFNYHHWDVYYWTFLKIGAVACTAHAPTAGLADPGIEWALRPRAKEGREFRVRLMTKAGVMVCARGLRRGAGWTTSAGLIRSMQCSFNMFWSSWC